MRFIFVLHFKSHLSWLLSKLLDKRLGYELPSGDRFFWWCLIWVDSLAISMISRNAFSVVSS